MDRRSLTDKQQEGTAKTTGKSGKSGRSGLGPWHYSLHTYQEPTGDQRELHGDPRSELAQHIHDQHQDSDLISSDDDSDPEYIHSAFGSGTTLDLNVSASTANDQGTLAGGSSSWPQYTWRGSASYSRGTKSESQLYSGTSSRSPSPWRSPWRSPSNFSRPRYTPDTSHQSSPSNFPGPRYTPDASPQSSPTSTLR
jgi:hypothetical protein